MIGGLIAKLKRGSTAVAPPLAVAGDYGDALLQAGFDPAAYRAQHPDLAPLGDLDCAGHYHAQGRDERLRAQFALPFAEAQRRAAGLGLSPTDARLLAQDIAADLIYRADPWGRDEEALDDFLRPHSDWRPLVIASDSHGMFYLVEDVLREAGLLPVPHLCTGASARGLGNAASRLGHAERVLRLLETRRDQLSDAVVLLKYGQVDLEFVHDFRRIRAGKLAFDWAEACAFAHDSVERYAGFLAKVQGAARGPVVVTAALPPALADSVIREGYVNAHIAEQHGPADAAAISAVLAKMEMPDLATRTRLAQVYNTALADACARLGLPFLDDHTPLLGAEGTVDPALVEWHGGTDHHLCFYHMASRRAAAQMAARLTELVGP